MFIIENFNTKINQEYVQLLGMAEKKEHTMYRKGYKKDFNRINSRFEFQAGYLIKGKTMTLIKNVSYHLFIG